MATGTIPLRHASKIVHVIYDAPKWLVGHGHHEQQVKWFIDHETGKTLKRREFERLQRAIFNGKIDTIVIWKLDRLSRRLRDGVNLLCDWCERGLRLVVVTQQIELSGPVGRMIAAVLLGLAEIELEFRRTAGGGHRGGQAEGHLQGQRLLREAEVHLVHEGAEHRCRGRFCDRGLPAPSSSNKSQLKRNHLRPTRSRWGKVTDSAP